MYCTKCGRKLEEGEVCTCRQNTQIPYMRPEYMQKKGTESGNFAQADTKDAEWAKEKGTQAADTIKDILKQMLQIIKRPVTKTAEMAANNSMSEGLRLLITKAVVFVVIICIIINRINSRLDGWTDIKIPYLSLIILTVIMTLGVDWIELLLLKAFSRLFKGNSSANAMYSVVGTRAVYELTVFVITAILGIVSQTAAMFVGGISLLLIVYIEAASYRVAVDMNEDKKVFAFFVAKVCTLIITVLLLLLIGSNIIDSLSNISYYLNY